MKKLLLIIAILPLLASCNGWLDDAKPKAFTEEEDLFSRETGFKETLTGAYQLAAKPALYGRTLTFDYLDKLAQRYRYATNTGALSFQNPAFYEFDSASNVGRIDNIWANAYFVIANLNNMLGWLETNRDVLVTPGYYEILRGEALALRSYLYFDLLRMYGPVPLHDPQGASVVYRTALNREASDLVPADQMLEHIVADLEEAQELLDGVDPLNFDYLQKMYAEGDEDPFLIFRQNRMNAMAVRALLARVHLWAGDKTEAEAYAREVINSGHFTLTRDNTQDHIMSSEVIFGVHVDKMQESITDAVIWTAEWVINDGTSGFYNALMNPSGGDNNDMRVRGGFTQQSGQGTIFYVTTKFDQTGLEYSMQGMMPLIRLSEMYFIMTECTGEEFWINEVRDARGILPLPAFADEQDMIEALGVEYRKEFYGEGQLWYFYKRVAADKDLFFNMNNVLPGGLADRHYIFNVPEDEYQFGGLTTQE